MRCVGFSHSIVLVGLQKIGLIGLHKAFAEIDKSGETDREKMVDMLIEILKADNYMPSGHVEQYRKALWREYLRHKGEDFREFYSEVDVTVRGEEGEMRDQFVKMLKSVFAHFELKPCITFAPGQENEINPQLAIENKTILRGMLAEKQFKTAVKKSFSDW